MRQSDLALIVIRLKISGESYVVLSRHEKWQDWTLVGGHVEPDEKNDWARAAAREANEELAPLRFGVDFLLLPLLDQPVRWGPLPSRSAAGAPTIYTAQLFALRFMKTPAECLAKLPQREFRIVREADIVGESPKEGILAVAAKALGGLNRAILAWDSMLSAPPTLGAEPAHA